MDFGAIIDNIQQNPPAMVGVGILILIIIIVFIYLRKGKKDDVAEQLKREMCYSWGREEIRNHTLKDLDDLSRLFTKYKKSVIIGGVVNKAKVGKGLSIMSMKSKNVIATYIDPKTNKTKFTFGEDIVDIYLLRMKIPRWESLNFFPFNVIFTLKKYLIFETKDILSENIFELRLKCDEFQTLYGVWLPLNDAMTKIAKIEEFPFRGFYEEINGRLQNEPAKIAQLDMTHTQRLAVADKQAEATAKILDSQKQQLRSM